MIIELNVKAIEQVVGACWERPSQPSPNTPTGGPVAGSLLRSIKDILTGGPTYDPFLDAGQTD